MARVYVGFNKEHGGFLVDIVLDNSYLVKKRSAPSQPPVPTKALIDTGASLCGTSERAHKALRFPTTSAKLFPVNTGNGTILSRRYYGAFYLECDPGFRSDCCVMNLLKIETKAFDFIIGMDVLAKWGFSYSPSEKGIWLENPPP